VQGAHEVECHLWIAGARERASAARVAVRDAVDQTCASRAVPSARERSRRRSAGGALVVTRVSGSRARRARSPAAASACASFRVPSRAGARTPPAARSTAPAVGRDRAQRLDSDSPPRRSGPRAPARGPR
jgi:hypothetical protein